MGRMTVTTNVHLNSADKGRVEVEYHEAGSAYEDSKEYFTLKLGEEFHSGVSVFMTEEQLAKLVEVGIKMLAERDHLLLNVEWMPAPGDVGVTDNTEHFDLTKPEDWSNGESINPEDIIGKVSE